MVRVKLLQNCLSGNNVGEIVGMEESEAQARAKTGQVEILRVEPPAPAMHRAVLPPAQAGKGK